MQCDANHQHPQPHFRPGLAGYRFNAGACWLGLPVDTRRVGERLLSLGSDLICVNMERCRLNLI
jgi:hypothetical protein